ncbi:MATE family efflux transporter [Glaciecola sp. 1036]|uniref:MATE family efflux transporter n=1 Tax=Alteromonadaceae TaxID=72275 RepID=UPI003D04B0C5
MNQAAPAKGAFLVEIKKLAVLTWPLLIAQVTQTLMGVSDTVMAGRYSAMDMAAVAVGFGVTLPFLVFIQGLCLALTPQIARIHGANKTSMAADWVFQALYLTLIVSILVLLLMPLIPNVLNYLDMSAELKSKTLDYIGYVFFSMPAFAVYQVFRNYCEGLSRTRPTMMIMFAGLIVNIPANYMLINGVGGLPEMGGPGCGLATMLVFYIMAIATVAYTMMKPELKQYRVFHGFRRFKWQKIKQLIGLGIPIAFTLLAEVTLFALAALLLAPFGANTVAAHQIALNFSALIFMLPLSIGMAVAIRIGFLMGENKKHLTSYAYKSALLLTFTTVGFTATFTVLGAHFIASLYTSNSSVIQMAAELLLLAAVFQFSDCIQVVGANSLRGYRDNKAMVIISLFSYWCVGFPTAVVLGLTDWFGEPMAAKGFWFGFIVGLSTAAILMTARVLIIQRRLRIYSDA